MEILASTLEELLAESVAVVRELVGGDSPVADREGRRLTIDAPEATALVRQLVRQLLDWYGTEGFIPGRLAVGSLDRFRLVGAIRGEIAHPSRHPPQPEVKALTRHDFDVRKTSAGWRAEMLFDV